MVSRIGLKNCRLPEFGEIMVNPGEQASSRSLATGIGPVGTALPAMAEDDVLEPMSWSLCRGSEQVANNPLEVTEGITDLSLMAAGGVLFHFGIADCPAALWLRVQPYQAL